MRHTRVVEVQTDTVVTLSDVVGADKARQDLEEVVGFLKHPEEYGRLAAHIPKGVLLVGLPGNGRASPGHRLRPRRRAPHCEPASIIRHRVAMCSSHPEIGLPLALAEIEPDALG